MGPITLSVTSTKGGVGKTTIAANLGALFARFGMNTLLIDADPQPSLSKYFELAEKAPQGLSDIILRGGTILPSSISKTTRDNLHIILSDADEKYLQTWLQDREDRLIIMRRAVASPYVRENYDVIVIDTQGAKGELQKTAAMAADIMISPVEPAILSAREFASGTMKMLEEINRLADFSQDFRSGDLYAVINGLDRSNDSRQIAEQIRASFRGDKRVRVMDTVIPTSTVYKAAATAQVAAFEQDWSNRSKPNSAYQILHQLLWELPFNLNGVYYDDVSAPDEKE